MFLTPENARQLLKDHHETLEKLQQAINECYQHSFRCDEEFIPLILEALNAIAEKKPLLLKEKKNGMSGFNFNKSLLETFNKDANECLNYLFSLTIASHVPHLDYMMQFYQEKGLDKALIQG